MNNVIEKVSENQSENPKEFFLPHRPVIRQNAESTKLRVVYDASAKSESGCSLKDCLEKGSSLQNKLWDILIRTRFRPVILYADIEKAFLQIRIKEKERESLKFHWVKNLTNNNSDSTFHQASIWVKTVTIYLRRDPKNTFRKV